MGLRKYGIASSADDVEPALQGTSGGILVEIASGAFGIATAAAQALIKTAVESLHSSTVFGIYASGTALTTNINMEVEGGSTCRRIIVGTAGTLVVTKADGTDVTIPSNVVGSYPVLDIDVAAIKSTSTAQDILVLW